MAVIEDRPHRIPMHPFHAFLVAATVPLFLGAVLSDWAYARTYEIQWTNFASWLIVGGLVFGGAALLCAVIDLFRDDRRGGRMLVGSLVLLAAWVLGFIDALVHGRDAWATMPTGFVLSIVVAVLACVATWLAFSGRPGGTS